MENIAYAILLIWIGATLGGIALLYLRKRAMTQQPCFDPNDHDHVLALAAMLDSIMNAERSDLRFALVIWQDRNTGTSSLISNDVDDKTVVDRLDGAKSQINRASGMVHPVAGHA